MPSTTTVLAVDLGGTTVKSGLVNAAGQILCQESVPTRAEEGPRAVIEQIEVSLKKVLGKGTAPTRLAIGIGSPGVVDALGNVKSPPNMRDWDSVPLAEEVMNRFPGFHVAVENDANVAAIAESRFGAGKDFKDFLFVIWGTGVGGGIILDGKIYRGPTGAAGEVGHLCIDYNGPVCNCGARGCVEAYIGQRYLSKRTAERLAGVKDSPLLRLADGDPSKIEPSLIAKAALAGDAFSKGILEEAGTLLGIALGSVMNTLDLRISIIGGGVSGAGDLVLKAAEASTRRQVLKPLRSGIRVLQATQGNAAGLLGAAGLVL